MFKQAMALILGEFQDIVRTCYKSWLPSRNSLKKDFATMLTQDFSHNLLILSKSYNWKGYLYEYERKKKMFGQVKFVLYPAGGGWNIQAVPVNEFSFQNRVGLYEPWRGLEGKTLCQVSGIDGCRFVHADGFLGSNSTFDGAVQMALRSMDLYISSPETPRPTLVFSSVYKRANLQLSEDCTVASVEPSDWSFRYVCVDRLIESGVFRISFHLTIDELNSGWIMFGATQTPAIGDDNMYRQPNTYTYSGVTGEIKIGNNKWIKIQNYPSIRQGDIIQMLFDMNLKTISFKINNNKLGIVFNDIETPLYPYIEMLAYKKMEIRILNFIN